MAKDQDDYTRDPLIRAFGNLLRGYRSNAGLSRRALADALGCTSQWIEKLETGTKPSVATGVDLDTFFKIPERTFQTLAEEIARTGKHAVTPAGFSTYEGLEARAHSMRSYEAQVFPGLLQTEAYARGVMSAGQVRASLDELVEYRMRRQAVLDGDKPLRFTVVIDESALRRPIGGPKVMHEQLLHLKEIMLTSSTIQLYLLPYARPIWAALDGSFTIMGFADRSDVVYYEGPGSSQVIEDSQEAADCATRFHILMGEALTSGETLAMIMSALEDYT